MNVALPSVLCGQRAPVAAVLARVWAMGQGERLELAVRQIQVALPALTTRQCQAMARACFRHLAAVPTETVGARVTRISNRTDQVAFDNGQIVVANGVAPVRSLVEAGQGALILGAHLGNFELCLYAAAALGLPVSVVTKSIRPARVDAYWRRMRRRHGLEVIDDYGALSRIVAAVRSGRLVVMALDQHAPPEHAVLTTFFGQPAWTHRGLAVLAGRWDLPVVPSFCFRSASAPNVHHITFCDRLAPPTGADRDSLREATQRFTTTIEAAVRSHPEQWTWMHRRWKKNSRPTEAGRL